MKKKKPSAIPLNDDFFLEPIDFDLKPIEWNLESFDLPELKDFDLKTNDWNLDTFDLPQLKADEQPLQELETEIYKGKIHEIEVQEIETIFVPTYKLKRSKL